MTFQEIIKVGLVITLSSLIYKNSKSQISNSDSLIINTIDSILNSSNYYPSEDLLPAKFNSFSLKNIYLFQKDVKVFPGHITLLSLRDNCTFIFETFYHHYNNSRVVFEIGTYKVSKDSIYLTFKPLLKGKKGKIYMAPTLPVSWALPKSPELVLIDKDKLFETLEKRFKKKGVL